MCKFESSQKDKSRAQIQSPDSSETYRKPRTSNSTVKSVILTEVV